MDYERMLDEVAVRGALGREGAIKAVRATLHALGDSLHPFDARHLASELPEALGQFFRERELPAVGSREELFRRVAQHEGVGEEFAREHAQVVCEALADALDETDLILLRTRVPDEVAALLVAPPSREPAGPIGPQGRIERDTLASGRYGSTHPLSEGRFERGAQEHSVVREANPHGETKLSSARGTTSERIGRTLAEGHPGSNRPLSEDG